MSTPVITPTFNYQVVYPSLYNWADEPTNNTPLTYTTVHYNDYYIGQTNGTGNLSSNIQQYYGNVTQGVYTTGASSNYLWVTQGGYGYNAYVWGSSETVEQRIAREERELEYRKKQDAASLKAEQLLISCISEQQAKEYLEKGYFETTIQDKRYRIKKGIAGNVFLIDDKGKERYRYCIHPSQVVPSQDNMLAQLLMLHSDERKFLATANRTILHD